MGRIIEKLGTSTIPSTDTQGPFVGNAVKVGPHMLGIQTPEALTGNVYLEASVDDGNTWRRVSVYGADIQLAANRMVLVDGVPATMLRPASDLPELSDREFVFFGILQV